MSEFRQAYMGQWVSETSLHPELKRLAMAYHTQTEAYDRSVCTGPVTREGVMPATPQQVRLVNANAQKARLQMDTEARQLGFTRRQCLTAIQEVGRDIYREARARGLP